MSGKDGLRAQRSGAKPLENPALAIDGDDSDQRKYRVDGNQNRHENRYTRAGKTAYDWRGRSEPVVGEPAQDHEEQHGNHDGAESTHRLAHEDLDLDPRQFPKPAQHRSSLLLANGVTGKFEKDI